MNDLFDRVTSQQDIFKKLLSKIPGFKGYIERQNRRAADKLVRSTLAHRFEDLWQRISSVQTDMINQGGIEYIDDMEGAAIKIRQFIDRIKTAAYGYSGLFDAVKVNEQELAQVYQYDLALLTSVDEVGRAIDNVEASIGSDGLPAAIRNLKSISQSCVDAFNKRTEVILGSYGAAPDNSTAMPTEPLAMPPALPPTDIVPPDGGTNTPPSTTTIP
jgi:hypothetical protein